VTAQRDVSPDGSTLMTAPEQKVRLGLPDVDLVPFTSSVQVIVVEEEELSTLEEGKIMLQPKRLGGWQMIG